MGPMNRFLLPRVGLFSNDIQDLYSPNDTLPLLNLFPIINESFITQKNNLGNKLEIKDL